jgi:hypothetical protein
MLVSDNNISNKDLSKQQDDSDNIFSDVNYMRQSASLINNCLHKGSYVVQMTDGDIFVTETKTVTFQYTWDKDSGKLVRVTNKIKKKRNNQ